MAAQTGIPHGTHNPITRPSWEWQNNAACRGESLYLFFGPEGERQPDRDVRERKAKEICSWCPVRSDCLDYATSRPEKYGTWGGLNDDERDVERRRRSRRASVERARAERAVDADGDALAPVEAAS
ncbi:WhiB family transcriptional regulator [Sphaerisporangium sp. TRM90804]|uniref:WhiB family transcriptional regulator n=1 Tax=Sphaerisporangium sp. TRM90804 TaxID=3031113 RepID=UPI00244AD56E|nr:WhiB family transcriptional regulator [Sphaerisporangium sp. TRM90804]MDH2424816.1 WhiB family transcriptional regulator [Sphaerisporangium sp. TRM90804]